eukprot:gene1303-1645_t
MEMPQDDISSDNQKVKRELMEISLKTITETQLKKPSKERVIPLLNNKWKVNLLQHFEARKESDNFIRSLKELNSGDSVSWISKEQYLRNDITCRYDQCKKCIQQQQQDSKRSNIITFNSSNSKNRIVIIPDINTIREYLEVLELQCCRNIIVLETIYKFVQYNSGPKFFERLRSLLNIDERSCSYFSNELFTETFVDRKQEWSFTQYQYEVVLKSVQWFMEHWRGEGIKVYLMTSDQGLLDLKREREHEYASIETITLQDYLTKYHPEALPLYDSISQLLTTVSQDDSKGFYDRYWNDDVMLTELKSGNIMAGKIHYNSHNREEAFIKLTNQNTTIPGDKILIIGKKNQNRAIHGDKVGVSLLPESEWLSSSSNSNLDLKENEDDGILDLTKTSDNNVGTKKTIKQEEKIPTGKVVGIYQRNWRDYVCTVEKGSSLMANYVFVIPIDWRIPWIRVPTKNAQQMIGKRIIVRIDTWDLNSNNPTGHFVSEVGESGSLETELSALLVEHDISLRPWSQSILSTLPKSTPSDPWHVPESEWKTRRTIPHHHTMSIDPLGSKDIDDAISVGYLEGGRIVEIGVHIADVSFFVNEGSALDTEARRRGTTIYLPDRRYDMLPAVLSEDVCSLRGGFDRCAMSVIWKFDSKTNEIIDVWFGRTVIHSCAELHYQLAQDIIDGKIVDGLDKDEDVTNGGLGAGYKNRVAKSVKISDLKKDLLVLRSIFRHLKKQREDSGALDLESIEVRFKFNPTTNKPEKIVLKTDLEVHSLVAEFMILANAWVGTKIHSYFPSCALLRRHPQPNQLGFDSIKNLFNLCGFSFNSKTNKELAESLKNANDDNDPFKNQILKLKTVNVVSEAVYFSTGSLNVSEYYHYGLALDKYTHFTSPIRRYADIIVHRMLWDSLNKSPKTKYTDYGMTELTDHLNLRHRASKTVQRDATELFQSLYFQLLPKSNVNAIITDIRSNAIVVYVPEYGLRNRVFLVKDGSYLIPDHVFNSKVTNIEFNETNIKISLENGQNKQLFVFDHILIDIRTEESLYHLSPIRLDFIKLVVKSKETTKKKQLQQPTTSETIDISTTTTTNNPKTKMNLIQDIKKTENEKKMAKEKSILFEPSSEEFIQSTDKTLYNIIKQFQSISLLERENGSKINYDLGKNINLNQHQQQQQKQHQLIKLWNMSENQSNDYRKRSDKYLRDSISKKYQIKNQDVDDNNEEEYLSNEKIAPSQNISDRYKNLISRTEKDLIQKNRAINKAKSNKYK